MMNFSYKILHPSGYCSITRPTVASEQYFNQQKCEINSITFSHPARVTRRRNVMIE